MAYPRSLGQVMSFSRKPLMLFTGLGMIASNGYKRNRNEDSIIILLVREDIRSGDPPFYNNIMKKPAVLTWRRIQIQEQNHAIGHARKIRTTSQTIENTKLLFAIVNNSCCETIAIEIVWQWNEFLFSLVFSSVGEVWYGRRTFFSSNAKSRICRFVRIYSTPVELRKYQFSNCTRRAPNFSCGR